jgi:protein-S-isoprenylcysteine O-methyltransferase Ste14
MTPLPYVWPYALIYWAVFLWAFWPEFAIVQRARKTATAADAKSVQVIVWGGWLAFITAFPLASLPSAQFHTHRVTIFFVGIGVLLAGSLLRRHCWRMLGASFTGDVRARADQQVITRGAYSVLRHPSYTAGILMNTSIGLALGSWASTLILGVAAVAVYSYRIAVEERALSMAIGEPYRAFVATRKRLIPYVY